MASLRQIPGRKVYIACFIDKDGKRRQKSTGTRIRKDAQKIADEYEAASRGKKTVAQVTKVLQELMKESTGQEIPTYTLRAYCETYLTRKAPRVGSTTLIKYRNAVDCLLKGLGEKAEHPIAMITTEDLNSWQLEELKRIAPATLQLYTKLVRGVFRQAQAEGLRTDNPTANLETLQKDKKVRKAFDTDQLRALLRVATAEWRSMILFGAYTGQRLGDIAGLTWSAIDTEKNLITLRTIKTDREMHIPIAEPLLRHIATLPTPKSNDAPIHPELSKLRIGTLSNQFGKLLEDAGIREKNGPLTDGKTKAKRRARHDLSFHCLRHTAVSMMKNAGIGESIVMDLIGHESEAVSRGYTHLDLASKRAALATLPDITQETI
jgi:integrase